MADICGQLFMADICSPSIPLPGMHCSVAAPPQEETGDIKKHAFLIIFKCIVAKAKGRKEPLLTFREVLGVPKHL